MIRYFRYLVLFPLCYAAELAARRLLFEQSKTAGEMYAGILYRDVAKAARAAARAGAAAFWRDSLTGEE